jgi:hypothetical protein
LSPHPTRTIYHWPRLKMEFQLFKIILNPPTCHPTSAPAALSVSTFRGRCFPLSSVSSTPRPSKTLTARPLQSTTSEVRHGEDLSKRERYIYIEV